MFEYRITKYNPKNRDTQGRYLVDEWTAYSDIGQEFGGSVLTREEYLRVENTYVDAAIKLLDECGVSSLVIDSLENHLNYQSNYVALSDGQRLRDESLREGIRSLLRGDFWCRLQDGTRAFIHVGYDYYMYIGVPCPAQNSVRAVQSAGLFVEPFESPYKELS